MIPDSKQLVLAQTFLYLLASHSIQVALVCTCVSILLSSRSNARSLRHNAMQALQKTVRFGPAAKVTLQAASLNSLMPAQYQPHERLLAQVRYIPVMHLCTCLYSAQYTAIALTTAAFSLTSVISS